MHRVNDLHVRVCLPYVCTSVYARYMRIVHICSAFKLSSVIRCNLRKSILSLEPKSQIKLVWHHGGMTGPQEHRSRPIQNALSVLEETGSEACCTRDTLNSLTVEALIVVHYWLLFLGPVTLQSPISDRKVANYNHQREIRSDIELVSA